MKKLFASLVYVTGVIALAFGSSGVAAMLSPETVSADTATSAASHVIINEIKLGGSTNAAIPTEYITLFNPTNASVTLDGWKIEYAKASATVDCQNPNWAVTASQITSLSGALSSNQISTPIARSLTDNKDGSVHLVDNNGIVQDLVGWGAAAPCKEATEAAIPANDKSIERDLDCVKSFPIDTDNNSLDFDVNASPNPANLNGVYSETCQQVVPAPNGTSNPPNSVPAATCDGIVINELLPNPSGSDTGNEFIELYNPTKSAISLDGCSLQTSANSKTFSLNGITLQSGEYKALNDGQTGLTLANASGGTAWLLSPTDELQAINYPADLADNVAWALSAGSWQKTYTPTPGATNAIQSNEPCPANEYRDAVSNRCRVMVSASTLVPCKSYQVRNPSTNRCKSILATNSTLTPCKPGQYRNPETNRCKSLTSTSGSTLKPCAAGKERNPATNRCRSILAAGSILKACAVGQVRNPDTNRCRKDTSANLASVKDVSSTPTSNSDHVQWVIGVAIILGAIGYACYEWRDDIIRFVDKAKSKIPFVKQPKLRSK